MAHRRVRIGWIFLFSVWLGVAWAPLAHAQDTSEATTASAFVTRLYEEVLGRPPDSVGLQGHLASIAQFGSVVTTVLAFFHSEEFLTRNTSDAEFLTILYRTFLNRAPDSGGFTAFLGDLSGGCRTRDDLLGIFIRSQEFQGLASFLPPLEPLPAFVTTLYILTLGRGPDAAGLQGFVAQLQQTRQVLPVVQGFLGSSEFLARNTTNTEYVTVLFGVFLDRVPDCPGLAFFVARLTQGTATRAQIAAEFAASSEFQAIQNQLFPPTPPDIRGTYTIAGTITQSNCVNQAFNRTIVFTADLLFITSQVGGNFSGNGRIVEVISGGTGRVDLFFSGSVNTAAQLSGTLTANSFFNDAFDGSANGTFTGLFSNNTITFSFIGLGNQSSCTYTAQLSGHR